MKVSFYNIGCKVNFAEMSAIREQFRKNGFDIVEFGEESDMIFINTCTVTARADADCRKIIRRSIRNSPDAFIGVMGCFAQLQKDEIFKIDGVDAVFGVDDKFDIQKLMDKFEKKSKTQVFINPPNEFIFRPSSSADDNSHTRAILKIQDGCDYKCSYCAVPLARGASRSMKAEMVIAELKKIEDQGFYEVVLSGVNLGDWQSEGKKFVHLLEQIEKFAPSLRIRLSSLEPDLLNRDIIDIVCQSKIFCPHFHIPLQSGSAEVLAKMRRRYKPALFIELITLIKNKIPHCGIGVDLIAGFPGESERNFTETYELLEGLPISYLHVFKYSERSGTVSEHFPEVVPNNERKRRTLELRRLSEEKLNIFLQSEIGAVRLVIPEYFSKKDKFWTGFTENYIRAFISIPNEISSRPLNVIISHAVEGKAICDVVLSDDNLF